MLQSPLADVPSPKSSDQLAMSLSGALKAPQPQWKSLGVAVLKRLVDGWRLDLDYTAVVPHDGLALAERPPTSDARSGFPVEVEVGHPGRDPDKGRPASMDCIAQADAVPSRAEMHLLLHIATVPRAAREAGKCLLRFRVA